jgi:DNA repair photolyase
VSRLRRRIDAAVGVPRVRAVRVGPVRLNGPRLAPVLGTDTAASRGAPSPDRVTEAKPRLESLELPLDQTTSEAMRQAALPVLEERLRGTKFVSLTPKSLLNSPRQTGTDFWSLNPYVGCEFGCSYCYARYAHRYVVERAHDAGELSDAELVDFRGPHGWEAFERRIFVKDQLLGALEADLRRYWRSGGPAGGPPAPLVIGTATDPYQPAERQFRLTRRILERLARSERLNVGLITKSPLVARDRDLLGEIQKRSDLEVYLSLITVDRELIKKVEARSPMPAARLAALAKLAAAGINVGLIVAPILPGISDDVPHLEALFRAARDAGARFVHTGPLRLYPAVRERFLPVLGQHFPELAPRYERAYARQSGAPREYAQALAVRIRALQVRFGFPVNDGMVDRYRPRRPVRQGELAL